MEIKIREKIAEGIERKEKKFREREDSIEKRNKEIAEKERKIRKREIEIEEKDKERRRRETNCRGSNTKEDKRQEEEVREVSGQDRDIVKEYQGVSLEKKL